MSITRLSGAVDTRTCGSAMHSNQVASISAVGTCPKTSS